MPGYYLIEHRSSGVSFAIRLQEKDRASAIKRLRYAWSHLDPFWKECYDRFELVYSHSAQPDHNCELDIRDCESIAVSKRRNSK